MDWKFEKNMYPILDTRVVVKISYLKGGAKYEMDKI